ncbi:hypothetical protein BC828DRAFT_388223 [Blastocladiella britannica]|nr:hypothetical protein BC828DRAFT_388223 [Blastocladiella britannica]
MATAFRTRALSAYRRLLRVQQQTFAGDLTTLHAAHLETRKQFLEARAVTDATESEALLEKADAIAVYLERNIVQAVNKGGDRYNLQLDPKRHEINDNDENKKPYVKGARIPCCGAGSEALPRVGVNY